MPENKWELTIEKGDNGYILKGNPENQDTITKLVIEEPETEEGELETMKRVLYEIKEYFGIYHSKHNKKNLVIEVQENKE